jgi:transcription elongation GreA/GreB family factor
MQQLLDKWERLRTSEYLRPDEKLMLNHCISDLKRFMDHSGEATEMVGKQQTAVEWLISQLQQTRDYQRVINEANQSGTSVRDVINQAKEMEKEQSHLYSAFCFKCINEKIPVIKFEDWINL